MFLSLRRNRCADRRLIERGRVFAIGLVLVIAITVPLRVAAQADPGDAGAQANSGYTISGTVVNSVTGEPVRHALVQVANLPGNPPSSPARR